MALGRVNEAQGIVGTAIALGAEVRVSDGKRPMKHALDVGVWRGKQALEVIFKQRQVEGLQGGGRPGLPMGQNRPAHGGHRDRRACQGVLQQPGISSEFFSTRFAALDALAQDFQILSSSFDPQRVQAVREIGIRLVFAKCKIEKGLLRFEQNVCMRRATRYFL